MKVSELKNLIRESIQEILNESSTIYLDRKEYPQFLMNFLKQYVGTIPPRIKMKVAEKANLMGQNGEEYFVININTGKVSYAKAAWVDGSGVNSNSEDALARGIDIDLTDKIIIEKDRFAGKIYFNGYIHPKNVNPHNITGPTNQLSNLEEIILLITRSLKPAYRWEDFSKRFSNNRQEYENTKNSLFQKGMLNKAGAITVSGRNYLEQKGWGLYDTSRAKNDYLKKKNIDPQTFGWGQKIHIDD